METCIARASAAVVQRVPPAATDRFLQWQRDVAVAAEKFAGYQGVDIYPPRAGHGDEWVAVMHFEDDESLQRWLTSPVRAQWVEKLHATVGEFDLRMPSGGFGSWFVGATRPDAGTPSSWKMALTVLLGLYPTVMLLGILVGPYLAPLGPAVSMLVGNALSVSLLQWAVMPWLTLALARWLETKPDSDRRLTAGGLCLLVLLLLAMAAGFRQVTG